jgi:hypothetical protein
MLVAGRDSIVFEARDFDVVSLDASAAMVEHASRLLSRPTLHLRHQEVAFQKEFDGVWSMASLLHVPRVKLPAVLMNYRAALVPGGVWFASFKHGAGELVVKGRLFSDHTRKSFETLLGLTPGLALIESFVSLDTRPGRETEEWLTVLCRREGDE